MTEKSRVLHSKWDSVLIWKADINSDVGRAALSTRGIAGNCD